MGRRNLSFVLTVWRLAGGLSQDEAGDLLGVTGRAWGAWERGERVPSFHRAMSAMRLLDVPAGVVGDLYAGSFDFPPPVPS